MYIWTKNILRHVFFTLHLNTFQLVFLNNSFGKVFFICWRSGTNAGIQGHRLAGDRRHQGLPSYTRHEAWLAVWIWTKGTLSYTTLPTHFITLMLVSNQLKRHEEMQCQRWEQEKGVHIHPHACLVCKFYKNCPMILACSHFAQICRFRLQRDMEWK